VPRKGTYHIIVMIVAGSLMGFWGLVTDQAMLVAVGMPLLLVGTQAVRHDRLERLVEELRTQRTETR
jgi:predicted permease